MGRVYQSENVGRKVGRAGSGVPIYNKNNGLQVAMAERVGLSAR